MIRREVRVTPHHLRALPAPHFLQREKRRARLQVPAGPGMPLLPSLPFSCASERFIERMLAFVSTLAANLLGNTHGGDEKTS